MKYLLIALMCFIGGCGDGSERAYTEPYLNKEYGAQLVLVQDNVRLYRVWTVEPQASNHWTYFTTPCGKTSSAISYHQGKTLNTLQSTVNGVCE